jgi:hypothetical protein
MDSGTWIRSVEPCIAKKAVEAWGIDVMNIAVFF